MFTGDAITDPLSGLTAAVRALTDPPGSLISISMADVVAGMLAGPVAGMLVGALDGTRAFPREGPRGGAPATAGTTVAGQARPPRARTPAGEAPPSGADTDSVLSEL